MLESSMLVVGVSFNQPGLCLNATWDSNGTTFADNNTVGSQPKTIFINNNNTVYTANNQNGTIQIWLEGSPSPTATISTNSSEINALFVSEAGDIYVDNGHPFNRVDVWRQNSSNYVSTLSIGGTCYSIFIDTNNSLYCSLTYDHRVLQRSLNSSDNQLTMAAGNGCAGYKPHLLYYPSGIFVTISFDLYVADAGNNRIQFFWSGQVNGTTVAGRDVPGTVTLRGPTAVMLDAVGYLFILDCYQTRIIASGPDGFRCVFGCTNSWGSDPNQLIKPNSMTFDSYGNIFVVDTDNNRVQKFFLSFNVCSK